MEPYTASRVENIGVDILSGVAALGGAALGWYLGQKCGSDISFFTGPIGVLFGGGGAYALLNIPLQGLVCSRDLQRAQICLEKDDLSNVEKLAESASHGSESVSQQAEDILKEIAARAA